MNYIYDILVNWNTVLYDFYAWEINDEITHIRKIPIIKVSTTTLFDLENFKVAISEHFLKQIWKQTETFTNKSQKTLDYVSLFSDGETVLAIKFNQNGLSTFKSKLLIDEEEEILEIVLRMKETELPYKLIKREKQVFQTRHEIERKGYLKKELKKLKKESSYGKLKYLYYECFNEKIEEKEKMLIRLEDALKENRNQTIQKMEEFFKLTSLHQ